MENSSESARLALNTVPDIENQIRDAENRVAEAENVGFREQSRMYNQILINFL